MKNRWYLYIDDERKCPFDFIRQHYDAIPIYCHTYNTAIQCLQELSAAGAEILIDLDHDLGERKTGYDICKYIVENHIPLFGFHIHSMNPVGVRNMEHLLIHYGYSCF